MSQNWFPGQNTQFGQQQQQQAWDNQQQGWVQGGQWAGHPHPQQMGYGNQQQSFQLGYQQGHPSQFQQHQFQAFDQQQQFGPQAFPQQQPHQQQFVQPPSQPPHQHSGPQQQSRGGHFLSQQEYAKEHEKRAREEKRKKELEEQKKKLQSLSVAKQTVTLDDLFEKQLPEVSRAAPLSTAAQTTSQPPPVSSQSTGSGRGEDSGSGGGEASSTTAAADHSATAGVSGGDGTTVGHEPAASSEPNTAETFQKLMAESLDMTGSSSRTTRGQFKSGFKQPNTATKGVAKLSQSAKARSWGLVNDDFSGVFAQHKQHPQPQQGQALAQGAGEEDGFGDFQSSGQPETGPGGVSAFPVANQVHLSGQDTEVLANNYAQPVGADPNMVPSASQGGSGDHMMQSLGHMTQGGNHMTQSLGHMTLGGSHMIATSAYQGPLSSPNVLLGMQGQAPSSPQRQPNSSLPPANSSLPSANSSLPQFPPAQQHSVQTHVMAGQPQEPGHPQVNFPYNTPQHLNAVSTDPGNNIRALQVSSFGSQSSAPSGSPAPQSPPGTGAVDMSRFHPIYHKVYRLCCNHGDDLVSTELLYPVLLSSKLSRVQLRDLWSRANKGRPGKLSQMELFILLGLVALAQAGKADPSLEDLKRTSSMPVPTLPALSTLSPPPPSSSSSHHNNQPTDDFGQFHSSTTQLSQTTPTGPIPVQPVSIPVQTPAGDATNFVPTEPLQPTAVSVSPLQPLPPTATSATNSTTGPGNDKYAAFTKLQSLGSVDSPLQPNTAPTSTPAHLPVSSVGDYSSFNSAALGTTSHSAPLSSSHTQSLDKYAVFEGLRVQSNSPQPSLSDLATLPPPSLPPPTIPPLAPPPHPPQPDAPSLPPLLTMPSSNTSLTALPAKPPSDHAPNQLWSSPLPPNVPPTDHSGSKSQPKEDEEFGEFAQFSSHPTSTTSDTVSRHVGTTGTVVADVTPREGTSGSQATGESGGWADFAQFSGAVGANSLTSNPAGSLLNGQPQPLLAPNEQGALGNHVLGQAPPQTSTDSSSLRARGFEQGDFKMDQETVPTIDDMEKALLSKLTPTLPRKSSKGEDSGSKTIEQTVETPASTTPQPKAIVKTVSEEEVWGVCLVKCGEVLGMCVEVLKGAEEEAFLEEIAQSEEAHGKISGIAEVYRFAKRIYASANVKYPSISISATKEVGRNWQELKSLLPSSAMEKIYTQTQPHSDSVEVVTDVLSDTISHCAICLMSKRVAISPSLSLDGQPEEYTLKLLFHNGQSYHAPCANFWRHFVSEDVPVLG